MVSIAIQAGGQSSRMGSDKALIHLGGKRLIEHVLERVTSLSDDLFITTNHPDPLADLQLPLVPDEQPGVGSLVGLRTALKAARYQHVVVIACDMPFIAQGLILHISTLAGQADVVVPRLGENYEPMLALYNKETCLPALEQALLDGERRMISFYPQVDVLPLGPDVIDRYDPRRMSFFNINTPEDLARAEAWLREHSADPLSTPGQNPLSPSQD